MFSSYPKISSRKLEICHFFVELSRNFKLSVICLSKVLHRKQLLQLASAFIFLLYYFVLSIFQEACRRFPVRTSPGKLLLPFQFFCAILCALAGLSTSTGNKWISPATGLPFDGYNFVNLKKYISKFVFIRCLHWEFCSIKYYQSLPSMFSFVILYCTVK